MENVRRTKAISVGDVDSAEAAAAKAKGEDGGTLAPTVDVDPDAVAEASPGAVPPSGPVPVAVPIPGEDRSATSPMDPVAPRKKGDDLHDRLIGGKYRIISLIGEGGFGSVYRAEQQPVGRVVALKVIRGNAKDDDELRARFLREARSVARMQSPHIVTLYDYGEEPDGLLYGVFEFVDGRSLDQVIKDLGALTVPQAVTWTIEILEALSVAHDHGIVHRDLKPANVMIAKGSWGNETARVLDFGIAKVVDHDGDELNQTVATRQGLILGTPHYMAPEQAHASDIDGRTDLYAVGILMYAMLAGKPPFEGKSAYSILEAHVTKPVGDVVSLLPPSTPDGLRAVIGKAMAKLPEDRWPSARAMAEALAPFVGELGETQALSATSDRIKRPTLNSARLPVPSSRRLAVPKAANTTEALEAPSGNSKLGLIIALVVLLLAGGGVAAWLLADKDDPVATAVDAGVEGDAGPVRIKIGGGTGPAKIPDAGVVDAAPTPPDAAALVVDAAAPPPDAAPDAEPDATKRARPRRWRPRTPQRPRTPEKSINLEEF